jgi:hypothetical protein
MIYPTMFDTSNDHSFSNPPKLFIPLVAGYSTSLAIGILGKAITAVELTLNLDDKKNQAVLRK